MPCLRLLFAASFLLAACSPTRAPQSASDSDGGVCGILNQSCCEADSCGLGLACIAHTCQPARAGEVGKSCARNGDCQSGVCLPLGDGHNVCSAACSSATDCVSGWTCGTAVGQPASICECSPSPERCDGLDNDCNGLPDDAPECVACQSQADCVVGQLCDPRSHHCVTPTVDDGGLSVDAGAPVDGGIELDGGVMVVDGGIALDAGTPPDAGITFDAGPPDSGVVVVVDAGPADAGVVIVIDAGPPDAGVVTVIDAGPPDAGVVTVIDAGPPDAGVVFDAGSSPDAGVDLDAGTESDAGFDSDGGPTDGGSCGVTIGETLAPVINVMDDVNAIDPTNARIAPFTFLTLDGCSSIVTEGDPIVSYGWRLVMAPEGSVASLPDSGSDVSFIPGAIGQYIVALTTTTQSGAVAETQITLNVGSSSARVLVQLTWPQSYGDVDLHYIGPGGFFAEETPYRGDLDYRYALRTALGNEPPEDSVAARPAPDWGGECEPIGSGCFVGPDFTTTNDAVFELDQQRGYGPEIVTHTLPFDGTYQVSVHYYCARPSSGGTVTPIISVFVDDLLYWTGTVDPLTEEQVWDAAQIVVSNGGALVEVVPLTAPAYLVTQGCHSVP